MTRAFDAQNPPFDRLNHREIAKLRAELDIGYFAPGEVIVEKGKPAEFLHVIIKGAVEERDKGKVEAVLHAKESFDARALVHGSAGESYVAAEETLCYLAPKAIILNLIQSNPGFAAFFYTELSRKLTSYARRKETPGVDQVMRARVREARFRPAIFIDADKTIAEAGQTLYGADARALFVRDGARTGILTGTDLAKSVVVLGAPLDGPARDISTFDLISVDSEDFIFEALIKMTRHKKRRLAVTHEDKFIGVLEDIDILGLVAGNSQLIPGRIDRARSIAELEKPAHDIQDQVERLAQQGVKVEVIAEITSDLNRGLFAKLYDMTAPPGIKEAGCLMVMGSEGRGEQTVRTDQDNGLLLAHPVDAAELQAFRTEFSAALESFGFPPCLGDVMVRNPQWSQTIDDFLHQIRGWILQPDDFSPMNLGIFFDAVAVAGRAELVDRAKAEVVGMMSGETARLAFFARAIDQFENASAGVFTSLMVSLGAASGVIHIKKSGIFPIVHGVRTLAIEHGVIEASTAQRIDALVSHFVFGEQFGYELKSALSYLMEVRLRTQLHAMKKGAREEEAIVRLGELSTGDRDLLRDSLKVVKRFREVVRNRYHLGLF
jgi:CBS domain-containing protein